MNWRGQYPGIAYAVEGGDTRSANIAKKLCVGNALTRGAGNTVILLEEVVVRWFVITVPSPFANAVKTDSARIVQTIWIVCLRFTPATLLRNVFANGIFTDNCCTITDPKYSLVDLSDSEYDEDDWLCGSCFKVKQAQVKKHRDMDPLAMRALFGEKFSLSEICDVMERQDMEKANREGWLKRVLEEVDDYDMPELIDPDESEELVLDMVGLDEGDAMPGSAGSGEDGDSIPDQFGPEDHGDVMSGLVESNEDGPSDQSIGEAQLDPSRLSDKEMGHGHSTVEGNLNGIDASESHNRTKGIHAITNSKAISNRPQATRCQDKSGISMENPSCHDDTEASCNSIELDKGIVATTERKNPPRECIGAASGEMALVNVEPDPDQSLCWPPTSTKVLALHMPGR